MQYFLVFGLPAVFIVISIPLILKKVPPNALYGFRTPKTMASETVWYPANVFGGWALLLAGVAGLAIDLALLYLGPSLGLKATKSVLAVPHMVCAGVAVVASLLYLRKL